LNSYGAGDNEIRYQEEQATDDADHDAGGDVVRGEQQYGRANEDETQDEEDNQRHYPTPDGDCDLYEPDQQASAELRLKSL
jgi:hypothetical protein